jgi:enoyl-CoA hydratase/carnithine racemase
MAGGHVTVEREGAVAVLRLDRPDRQNALDEQMLGALADAVGELEASPPRAVVVTGSSEAFCTGLDLNPGSNPSVGRLLRAVQARDRDAVEGIIAPIRALVDRLVGLPAPVIAAVNGPAFGAGAEIAVRCDLRVLDATATLCLIGARMGLATLLGGGSALVRLIGPARAADLLLSGRKVSVMEAFSLGLANRMSEPGKALDAALQTARSIARNGPRAVRAALRVLRSSPGLSLAAALDLEHAAAVELILSGEFLVGMSAAMAHTEPDFSDVE